MSTQHTLVLLARGGYAARGVLYLIIGIFALLAAHDSTKPKDSHKSLEALLSQPFGYVLIGVVVAGLLACWPSPRGVRCKRSAMSTTTAASSKVWSSVQVCLLAVWSTRRWPSSPWVCW